MIADNFDPQHGFLPQKDPLKELPTGFSALDQMGRELPKLLLSSNLRKIIAALPSLDISKLSTAAELERAMALLSFIGHAYVWGEPTAASEFPPALAVPWYEVGKRLGRPPVLSYASYALHNWQRIEKDKPVGLGNIALLQNFLGGVDEEWFVLIHVDIEALAIPAIAALKPAQSAASQNDIPALTKNLNIIASSLEKMNLSLSRMTEHCDPYIYYNRVRPYIHGWKKNPAIPNGLIYQGVSDYNGQPQQFRGETGAQSSIIPCIDAVLGISQKEDMLYLHLREMREYMPPAHRSFMEQIESGPSVRNFIISNKDSAAQLKDAYNNCVQLVEKFRLKHLEYAASYIDKQSETGPGNPTKVGTAGTPFLMYLKKHKNTTTEHLI